MQTPPSPSRFTIGAVGRAVALVYGSAVFALVVLSPGRTPTNPEKARIKLAIAQIERNLMFARKLVLAKAKTDGKIDHFDSKKMPSWAEVEAAKIPDGANLLRAMSADKLDYITDEDAEGSAPADVGPHEPLVMFAAGPAYQLVCITAGGSILSVHDIEHWSFEAKPTRNPK